MLFSGNSPSGEASFTPFYAHVQFTAWQHLLFLKSCAHPYNCDLTWRLGFKESKKLLRETGASPIEVLDSTVAKATEALILTVVKATAWLLWWDEGQKDKKGISGEAVSRLEWENLTFIELQKNYPCVESPRQKEWSGTTDRVCCRLCNNRDGKSSARRDSEVLVDSRLNARQKRRPAAYWAH